MNRVTLSTRGLDVLRARLAALPAVASAAAGEALCDVAEGAAEEVRATLEGATEGSRSPPGAVPDDPKGRIAAALKAVGEPGRAYAAVMVDLPFARDLEFGTSKTAARPFLRPVMLEAGRRAGAGLGAALRGAAASLKGSRR